jgi:hypothetical protein
MEKLAATTVSKVYAHIIANPGATSREIRKGMNIPGDISLGSSLAQLKQRGAVVSMPGESPRNTKYYKGAAPVKLNQARGITQKKIHKEVAVIKTQRELVRDMQLLIAQFEALGN